MNGWEQAMLELGWRAAIWQDIERLAGHPIFPMEWYGRPGWNRWRSRVRAL